MLILLALAAGITFLLSVMAMQYYSKSKMLAAGFFCLIFINLILFFMTLCGEMGVPQSVYERYYKLKYIKSKVEDENCAIE